MKINLQARMKNKTFWLALIPAVLLLVQTIGAPFGYQWDFFILNRQLADIINAAFGVLTLIGVVMDPTTTGLSDSSQAMTYTKPKERDADE